MRFSVFVATFAAIAPFALAQNTQTACGQCDESALSALGECSTAWSAALAACEACGAYQAPRGTREKCARQYQEEAASKAEEEKKKETARGRCRRWNNQGQSAISQIKSDQKSRRGFCLGFFGRRWSYWSRGWCKQLFVLDNICFGIYHFRGWSPAY
jgi:hypothetical protein